MNIAFDIDGVLVDVEKFQLEYGAKFFKEKYNMDIVNKNGYSIKEIFDCTDEQEYLFWKNNIMYYAMNYPARVGCGEMIKKIIQDGNKCYIISSRIKTSDQDFLGWLMRTLVKLFLKKEDIPYENITFCSIGNSSEDKVRACLENEIDVMVEDCPANIDKLKEVTKVVCFNASYNEHIDGNDVIKVNSFSEIYDYVNRINQNNEFKFLKRSERQKLNNQELIKYYEDLKHYYISRTDKEKISLAEKYYSFIFPTSRKIIDANCPYSIEGFENLPTNDGVIFVANHRSMIDPPLVMSVIGDRPTHLLLKSEFLDTKFSFFLRSIGCVFVDRENKDSQKLSKEELIKIVLNGGNVLIFPEGTRNKTARTLLDFKLGAVSIARVTGAPIVPIAIVKEEDKRIVKIGKPINVDYCDDIIEKNEEVRSLIEKMIIDHKFYNIAVNNANEEIVIKSRVLKKSDI